MQDRTMEYLWSTGHLSGSNVDYVEELYDQYLLDPESIPFEWRDFFDSLPAAPNSGQAEVSLNSIERHFRDLGRVSRPRRGPGRPWWRRCLPSSGAR